MSANNPESVPPEVLHDGHNPHWPSIAERRAYEPEPEAAKAMATPML